MPVSELPYSHLAYTNTRLKTVEMYRLFILDFLPSHFYLD